MNTTKLLGLGSFLLMAAILAIAATPIQKGVSMPIIQQTAASATTGNSPNGSAASWVSHASTVKELMLEANLVVRARVSKAPVNRILSIQLPMVDQNGQPTGSSRLDQLPFSDTVFDVLHVYHGKASPTILVMQTGGTMPGVTGAVEMVDDPLFRVGDEYVLFLDDISADPIQAHGRQLYVAVNPAGRYRIDGLTVFSFGAQSTSARLPATITELESQINQAVN